MNEFDEKLLENDYARGYAKGRASALRTNQSGCCCIIDVNDNVVEVCGAHRQWLDSLVSALPVLFVEDQPVEK